MARLKAGEQRARAVANRTYTTHLKRAEFFDKMAKVLEDLQKT